MVVVVIGAPGDSPPVDVLTNIAVRSRRAWKQMNNPWVWRSTIKHLAPTPVGQPIHCTARDIAVDGSKVQFQIEARDAQEVIVRGLHKRAVIRTESFTKRVTQSLPDIRPHGIGMIFACAGQLRGPHQQPFLDDQRSGADPVSVNTYDRELKPYFPASPWP